MTACPHGSAASSELLLSIAAAVALVARRGDRRRGDRRAHRRAPPGDLHDGAGRRPTPTIGSTPRCSPIPSWPTSRRTCSASSASRPSSPSRPVRWRVNAARWVLPPATLRAWTETVIADVLAYVRGDRPRLDAEVAVDDHRGADADDDGPSGPRPAGVGGRPDGGVDGRARPPRCASSPTSSPPGRCRRRSPSSVARRSIAERGRHGDHRRARRRRRRGRPADGRSRPCSPATSATPSSTPPRSPSPATRRRSPARLRAEPTIDVVAVVAEPSARRPAPIVVATLDDVRDDRPLDRAVDRSSRASCSPPPASSRCCAARRGRRPRRGGSRRRCSAPAVVVVVGGWLVVRADGRRRRSMRRRDAGRRRMAPAAGRRRPAGRRRRRRRRPGHRRSSGGRGACSCSSASALVVGAQLWRLVRTVTARRVALGGLARRRR